ESVRLFVDRAQAAKPDFRITNSNAPALAELCDRLEGIPLAIELAAARALVLSPSQMLSQLGNRFEFLVSRKRGLAERQRTLRAAIDWSYRLLTPDVQRFFSQLCVFRGGWSLEAAESVCDEPLALDMLAQLRECSLITTVESGEGGIRFRMLETLREYAQSQLSPEEMSSVRERHAQFLISLAEEAEPNLRGVDQSLWLDRLEIEQDNVREALRWSSGEGGNKETGFRLAAGFSLMWVIRGYLREGRNLFTILLAEPIEDLDKKMRALALYGSGELAWHEGNHKLAFAHLEESLAISRELGDLLAVAKTLVRLSCVAFDDGDMHTGEAFDQDALAIYQNLGNRYGIAICQWRLSRFLSERGDHQAKMELIMDCLSVFREFGDQRSIALILINLGNDALNQQDFSSAREYLEESLKTFQKIGDRRGTASALISLATMAQGQGDTTAAREHCRQSLAIFRKLGNPANTTITIARLSAIVADLGEKIRAARLWGAVEQLDEQAGYKLLGSAIREYHKQQAAQTREVLADNKTFDRAWQEGRAMTMEQAVAYALEESGE
uniref:ATP-binding protein n=1 Tax=Armatimonas sp. TaxID=1872638 RepID=UPI003752161A